MIIGMKALNEGFYVKRCLDDFQNESFVDKIIVIDGKSTDDTVYQLKKYDKVEVYIHEWLSWYHDQEITTSNILLSYIPNGEIFFILDFDERMSQELKNTLHNIAFGHISIPDLCSIHFPRRTYEVIRDENDNAIYQEDGWPIISHQIGQYPDFQMRLMKKNPRFHWINSPHHVPCGHVSELTFEGDILHYERDTIEFRRQRELQWARNIARRKELNLPVDVFEVQAKPEYAEAFEPEYWK